METKSINNQHHYECESRLSSCSSLWLWLSGLGLFTRVRKNQSHAQSQNSLNLRGIVHAVREVRAGLSALLLSVTANNRVFVGLGLMGVVAPLIACVYLLFDWRVDKVPGWYHDNYFHFFLLLAPYLFVLVCLIGVWYMFPEGSKRAYCLIVPTGYTIGKLMWLALVSNDTEFYSIVPASFILMGGLISAFLFIALDWLTHRKFHGADSFEARLQTLYNGADLVDDAKFKSMFMQTMRAKKEFKKQY